MAHWKYLSSLDQERSRQKQQQELHFQLGEFLRKRSSGEAAVNVEGFCESAAQEIAPFGERFGGGHTLIRRPRFPRVPGREQGRRRNA